jgi:phytoene dehydrogenase-like protein
MSDWLAVVAIFRDEAPEAAERIEARLRRELPGLRVTIPARVVLTRAEAHKLVRENGGNVGKAAKRAGLSLTTMYRRLRAEPNRWDPGPRMSGRLVR